MTLPFLLDIRFLMVKKTMELGLPAPEALAQDIFDQTLTLLERLEEILRERGKEPESEALQAALIETELRLLLGIKESLSERVPASVLEEYVNHVFLALGRLTLEELIQQEPSAQEWDYFLTYFRSAFEMLKKDFYGLEPNQAQETPAPPDAEIESVLLEAQKYVESLLRRLFA